MSFDDFMFVSLFGVVVDAWLAPGWCRRLDDELLNL